jgi:hypothetical protein
LMSKSNSPFIVAGCFYLIGGTSVPGDSIETQAIVG